MANKVFVIVGCGPAGVRAIETLRSHDEKSRIVAINGEPFPFYARMRLGEVVAGRVGPERLVLRPSEWFEERGVEILNGVVAEAVAVEAREVRLSDGRVIEFDALLFATGARPNVPTVPGVKLDGVLTLRTMRDALDLRKRALMARSCVVVGGGLLGLETAFAFTLMGLPVVVVENAPWLLPRQLDEQGGKVLQEHLEAKGMQFRLSTTVKAIAGEVKVSGVELASGEFLNADLVFIAAGVRPEVEIARNAGLAVNKGILVDDRLETSAPKIFAAGDCAEHRGRLYGFWNAAEAQGRAAGEVMAGLPAVYSGTVPAATLKVADVPVFSAGDMSGADVQAWREGSKYKRLVRDGSGALVGAILIGDMSERKAILAALESRAKYLQ